MRVHIFNIAAGDYPQEFFRTRYEFDRPRSPHYPHSDASAKGLLSVKRATKIGKLFQNRGNAMPSRKVLSTQELTRQAEHVPHWKVVDGKKLARTYSFPDFQKGLDFVNKVGAIAEKQIG